MMQSTRIGAAFSIAIYVIAAATPVLAADQEALYSKAEDVIRYSDTKALSSLIAQGLDAKKPSKNSQGRTLLTSAATEGKIPMMDVLIKAGVDPNLQDESGMTALRHVTWTGTNQVAAARRLITARADVNLVADDNWTPLIQAMYAEPAVAVPLGEVLLQSGADASIVNNEGNTALTVAAERALVALIPALVKGGADVNFRGSDGTPLAVAAEKGGVAVAKALLAAGADPNLGDKNNQTPLMKAAQRDRVDVIVVLVSYCARTDLIDSFFKWNALKFAKSEAAKSAIQAGTGPNCPK